MVDKSTDKKMSDLSNNIILSICFKFLEHIPEEYRNDEMRVFFEIEMAHWFYVDHFAGNPEFPQCKPIGFRDFARLMFQSCSYLKPRLNGCQKLTDNFNNYKQHIPTNGAMLIDKSLEYVLLVQGYFASSNSWGFPKGKVNEGEKSIDCAIREVQEEIGYDISAKVDRKISFSRYNNKALTQLFAVSDVERDFDFKPHLNKEIRKIQWFHISCLPRDRSDFESSKMIGMKPNNFYNVIPFMQDLLNFVKKEKAKRERREKRKLLSPAPMNNAVSKPVVNPKRTFTGESFLKHILNFDHLSTSPMNEYKPLTILVYSVPKELLQKSGPQTSLTSAFPDVEAPYSSPSSPIETAPRMDCAQATSAMMKLLNLKSKSRNIETISEKNEDDSSTLKDEKSESDSSTLKNGESADSPQQNLLDMLRKATDASIKNSVILAGPVSVRIETDNQSNFHIGSGPRQTFELIEEYKPLSTAFNPKRESKPVPQSVAHPPPLIPEKKPLETQEPTVHIINIGGKDVRIIDHPKSKEQLQAETEAHIGMGRTPIVVSNSDNQRETKIISGNFNIQPLDEKDLPKSRWLEWTQWSACSGGERIRVRSCLVVDGINCEGPSIEKQKCFSFMQSDIPFAKDPMIIEKEILGIDPAAPAAK
ncbi:hypothetical protein FO519_000186 [Halicephalobus sp. NKZ332]|nr:hypothetical protein FO519_000186 [Halicephalobus sp. NKZ332]